VRIVGGAVEHLELLQDRIGDALGPALTFSASFRSSPPAADTLSSSAITAVSALNTRTESGSMCRGGSSGAWGCRVDLLLVM
jgi:hypothetical protein